MRTIPQQAKQAIRDAHEKEFGWLKGLPMSEAAVQLAAVLSEILTGPTSCSNANRLAVCVVHGNSALVAKAMEEAAAQYYQNIRTAEKVKS